MTKKYIDWDKSHIYAYENDYNSLYEYLNQGLEVNVKSKNLTSIGGYVNFFKFDKNKKNFFNGVTPLYLAAMKKNNKCVKLLMERGADPYIKSNSKNEPKSFYNCFEIALLFSNFKGYYIMKKYKKKKNLLLNNDNLIKNNKESDNLI